MFRYTLMNDLAKVHRANILREAGKARSSAGSYRLGTLSSLLRSLWTLFA